PSSATLFPYTTLFRSGERSGCCLLCRVAVRTNVTFLLDRKLTEEDHPRFLGVAGLGNVDAKRVRTRFNMGAGIGCGRRLRTTARDRKSTRLNSSHDQI